MSKYSDFQKEIAIAAKASFDELRLSRQGEDFYAYALYTDSARMTVVPAANSLQGLQEVLTEINVNEKDEIPEFKWGIGEWKYSAWKSVNFKEISKKLRSDSARSNFDAFYERVLTDMIAALKFLDDDGFFGSKYDRNSVVIFASISDDDGAYEFENRSAKILNSNEIYENFLNRFNSS